MEILALKRDSFEKYMKEFAALYTLCFRVPMEEDEVCWRYLGNPNKEVLSCVAIDQGKLVANYSASPINLFKNGRKVKAALSLNTMTHPDYAGQGLFVKLASMVYQNMQEDGYKLVMGFPNNISHRTFVTKLGWNDICTMPTLELELEGCKVKDLRGVYEVIEDRDYALDYSLCRPGSDKIAVDKDQGYLWWRYRDNPAVSYRNFVIVKPDKKTVSSRIMIKEFRNRVNIVDAYYANEEEEKALINFAVGFGVKKDKELLTCWCPLQSGEHIILESYGFKQAAPVTYFGAKILNSAAEDEAYFKESNWIINMSDDNVY